MTCRGNETFLKDGKYYYVDTNELVSETYKTRPCGNCGRAYTSDGHDGCLGNLIGIMNACCGHGNREEAYVQFLDGEVIGGEDAHCILEVLKRHRKLDGEQAKEIWVNGIGWVKTK